MPVETWFPLAVFFEDLPDASTHRDGLRDAVLSLHGATSRRADVSAAAAWTGDVHGAERIHDHPAFDWITAQVANACQRYLDALGLDLSILDLFIQRSWPIVTGPGEHVALHSHPTAHISAVYYVTAPGGPKCGSLRFHDAHRHNELCPHLGSGRTRAYREENSLNYRSVAYAPVEGRIILFPSKQQHSVEKNESGEPRISLSYDMFITTRPEADPGLHEFLTPPPSQWKKAPALSAAKPSR